jgi:hypothetical protein
MDESGQYSDDDKLAAYNSLQAKWGSASPADSASINDVVNNSGFMKRMQATQNSFISAMSQKATAAATSSSALQAGLDAFNALPAADQKLVTPVFNGQSADEWKATTTARIGLARISEAAGSTSADPKVIQARTLGNEIAGSTSRSPHALNDWTSRVIAFLGQQRGQDQGAATPAVKIDLSDAAKAMLSSSAAG